MLNYFAVLFCAGSCSFEFWSHYPARWNRDLS